MTADTRPRTREEQDPANALYQAIRDGDRARVRALLAGRDDHEIDALARRFFYLCLQQGTYGPLDP